jgi:hypothetical protein
MTDGVEAQERLEVTDLELARALGELLEIEARLRVAPETDRALVSGLQHTLDLKRERVERLRAAIDDHVRNADLRNDDQREIAVES